MPDLRTSALAYLRDQKVRVLEAITHGDELRPVVVRALVQGHNGRYEITFANNVWSCTCGRGECAHVAAVALITGWPSAAAKPARERNAA